MVKNKESRWPPGVVWPFCDEGKASVYMLIIIVFHTSSFTRKKKRDFFHHISLDRICLCQKCYDLGY